MPTSRSARYAKALAEAAPGYRVSGSDLRDDSGGMGRLVLVERSKWTSSDSYPVTLMLATTSLRAVELWGSSLAHELWLGPMEWPWHSRIGFVMPEKRDVWWNFGAEGSVEEDEAVLALRSAFESYGLPALAQFGTEDGLFDRLAARFEQHGADLAHWEIRHFASLAKLRHAEHHFQTAMAAMSTVDLEEEGVAADLLRLRDR